jgi:competence protein ComEC
VALIGCTLAMLALPLIPARRSQPEAEVLAVGHGLAVAVRSGDGRALLYDAGRMGDPHVGRRLIAPALWARGVARLDAVILSHADMDHYDGLPDLLDRFPIGSVLVPPGFEGEANPGATALLDRVRTRGIPVRTIAEGDRWTLGRDVALSVLLPPAAIRPGAKDNERSVVLAVESGGYRLLLTGDLEGVGLLELVVKPAPAIDALLAPHHGGKAANPLWLYDWARPGRVVASQRRPSGRDALDLVADRGFPVWRTWERGAVRLRWTSEGLAAEGFLDQSPTFRHSEGRPMTVAASPTLIAVACLAAGLLAAGLLAVVEFGAWILVAPGRSLALPGDDPYPGEPIHVDAPDGVRLAGTWHAHPDASGRTLLLLHGLAEGRQMMRARADGIYARGWNIAILDARGYGDSGGGHASFGGREVADVRLWIDAIAARVGPALRLAAWGRSMGAGVALRAAADDPRVRALVLEAPYTDLHRTAATVLRRYRIPASRPLATLVLRRARRLAGVSLHRPRPIDAAPRVSVPVLILRGTADALVSPAETDALASALPGPVERIDVEGARHSKIVDLGGPALIDRVGAFLDRVI